MQNMSVARRRRERTDSAEYSDASYEDDNHINSGDEDEGDSEYDSAEHSVSDDLSERESGDGQAAPGSQKGDRVDHDEDRRNPQYIPKRGTFYEHDDRTAPGEEEGEATEEKDVSVKGSSVGGDVITTSGTARERSSGVTGTSTGGPERKPRQSRANAADKWTHDKFNENDQAPKSSDELVSIYGYDIRAEEGPPRAFRRRKYGRGPNKYTRNWEDEQAYSAKTTPARVKAPPQVTNGEEFPSLQSSSESSLPVPLSSITPIISVASNECPEVKNVVSMKRMAGGRRGIVPPGPLRRPYSENKDTPNLNVENKGDRRRNGTTHDIPKKTIEVIPVKKQDTDKNANSTKASHSTASDHHGSGTAAPKHASSEKGIVPKQRTAGTGRVGFVPPGPLRRPYSENKDGPSLSATKETSTSIQKNSVPPSAGLPSASLGGTQEKKSQSVRKPNTASVPPRMQHSQQAAAQPSIQPTAVPPSQQLQQISSTANNNVINAANTRASPPQQITSAQTQPSTQVTTEVTSGRGKRYSSIRQRPMPDQYQPVQYIPDYQPSPQQTQQPPPTQQQQIPAAIPPLPHRQTPPPSLQQSQQQQLLTQQNQQLLQTQQLQQQIHQKTPPPQLLPQSSLHQTNQSMQQMMQPAQGIHQTNPNIIQSTQHTQSLHQTTSSLHQPSQSMHQINPSMQQMHQPSPTLHQTNAPVHQSSAAILQSSPQMLQSNPPIHQASPSIHQSNPPMLQSTASLHPPTPSMIQSQQIHQQSTTLHQPSASLHQTNPAIHQASPTLHQASPTLHQSNPPLHQSTQPILQNNPPLHQVSPPLQTQMGRQGSAPAVSTIPMRQVQRTHQQMPIHNMPAPTHLQGSLPQQGLVASPTYPAQPMIPQTQYIQNNSSGMYSHNIPPQVYQPQQGYAAPPPPIPYHHQPTPPYQTPRTVYREPSGITFYSPQEQKGAIAPPPTRRPTNAIPIVPPPSRRDRERLSDAAAVQKDNIDHIVDNMFVPRHQQPRNAAPRPGDVAKTVEPVTSQSEPGGEEKSKDGSGDKSSKETSVEPITSTTVAEAPASIESQSAVVDDTFTQGVETLASEVRDKLSLEVSPELEQQHVDQEDISTEYVDCEQQIIQDVDNDLQQACEINEVQSTIIEEPVVSCVEATDAVSDAANDVHCEEVTAEEPIHLTEQIKETPENESSVVQVTLVAEEQTAAVVDVMLEPTVEEEKIDAPKDVPAVETVETLETVQEPAEKLPTDAAE